ncbi:hypothetical protein HK102_012252 [Quaeritorhiza haematococci]|nr:hypothetical protein HK102_012252 [Quaeritorhiza haematococci]
MATWSGFRSSSSSTYSYPTQNNGAARSNKQPAKLNKGDLPDTLWCYGCEKEKPISMFSSTQREKVANLNRIARKSAGAAGGKKFQPTCESCTPKQKLELRCIICGKTKELSGFSKAQRRMAAKDNGESFSAHMRFQLKTLRLRVAFAGQLITHGESPF